MSFLDVIIILLVAWLAFSYLLPYFNLKGIKEDMVDLSRYCAIDVRDYINSHNNPAPFKAEQIPLSYLRRSTREQLPCDKEIVLIADSKLSALEAARILRRTQKRKIYYTTR